MKDSVLVVVAGKEGQSKTKKRVSGTVTFPLRIGFACDILTSNKMEMTTLPVATIWEVSKTSIEFETEDAIYIVECPQKDPSNKLTG